MTEDLEDLLGKLHAELEATEQRPVETGASRWLGEAQAVAADVAHGAPEAVVEKRVNQVEELLANVETTGDPTADECVAQARDLAAEIRRQVEDPDGESE